MELLTAKIIEGTGRFRPSVNNRAYLLIRIASARDEVICFFVWNKNDSRCRIYMADELARS